jgi:hypothetical protein
MEKKLMIKNPTSRAVEISTTESTKTRSFALKLILIGQPLADYYFIFF